MIFAITGITLLIAATLVVILLTWFAHKEKDGLVGFFFFISITMLLLTSAILDYTCGTEINRQAPESVTQEPPALPATCTCRVDNPKL